MDKDKKDGFLRILALVVLLVLGLWFISFKVIVLFSNYLNQTLQWEIGIGELGDSFGAINSLFSGLAFAGVLIAIFMQRKDLQNQRIELKLQREELRDSRKEYQINRITNVVYKQLQRIDRKFNDILISDVPYNMSPNSEPTFSVLSITVRNMPVILDNRDLSLLENQSLIKAELGKVLGRLHSPMQVDSLFSSITDSMELLARLCSSDDLKQDDIEEVFEMFWYNLEEDLRDILRTTTYLYRKYEFGLKEIYNDSELNMLGKAIFNYSSGISDIADSFDLHRLLQIDLDYIKNRFDKYYASTGIFAKLK